MKNEFLITDLRDNTFEARERVLCKLAEDILMQIFVFNSPRDIGGFVKKYYNKLIASGMGELKSHHFRIAEWRIKSLIREDIQGNSLEFHYKK